MNLFEVEVEIKDHPYKRVQESLGILIYFSEELLPSEKQLDVAFAALKDSAETSCGWSFFSHCSDDAALVEVLDGQQVHNVTGCDSFSLKFVHASFCEVGSGFEHLELLCSW